MPESLKLDKTTTITDVIDTLNITVDTTKAINVPIFITTPEDLLGAAILYLNFARGKFDSITLIPYDTQEELQAAYTLAGEE